MTSSLHQLMKQGKISKKIYHRLRTTGLQVARLYRLSKVHKNGTPLPLVLSMPGRSYETLNNYLFSFFERLPGAKLRLTQRMLESRQMLTHWMKMG